MVSFWCVKIINSSVTVGARVRVGSTLSEEFRVECGLRQGCVLSPGLFSLFIMDLAWMLEERG